VRPGRWVNRARAAPPAHRCPLGARPMGIDLMSRPGSYRVCDDTARKPRYCQQDLTVRRIDRLAAIVLTYDV